MRKSAGGRQRGHEKAFALGFRHSSFPGRGLSHCHPLEGKGSFAERACQKRLSWMPLEPIRVTPRRFTNWVSCISGVSGRPT